jgi:type VII secretion protein EccB
MPSRLDQLHSYQFSVQRVVSALVMRETDPAQFPFRRVTVAGFASLMVGVVLIAGFGVYALFTGGTSDSWKSQTGAVLLEKGNGAHYVYKDGVLHPVRNLASALLYSGGSARNIVPVSAKSLSSVPRGPIVGIEDAPDSVPTPDTLVKGAWTACSIPVADASSDEGGQRSLLAIGDLLGVAGTGTPLTDETGTVVRTPGSSDGWLLWHQRKFLMTNVDPDMLQALGFTPDPEKLPTVDLAFLNAFEAGDPIRPPIIEHAGEGSAVSGYDNGDLLTNRSAAGQQFFVISGDKVEQITQVQVSLLAPRTEIKSVTTVPGSTPGNRLLPQGPGAMPSSPLKPVEIGDAGICATAADENGFSNIRYGVPTPDVSGLVRTAGRTEKGTALADYVAVQPGRGVLVEGYTVAKTSSGVVSLVTDVGQQFPIADEASRAALGFGVDVVAPSRMTVKLVSMLPQGSELSQKAAASTITLD